jgi:hypothetical protein
VQLIGVWCAWLAVGEQCAGKVKAVTAGLPREVGASVLNEQMQSNATKMDQKLAAVQDGARPFPQ